MDLFNLMKNGMKVSDYFTCLSGLWEEIESMNVLATVTTTTPEITKLLSAIDTIKEEARLFQFLDGLDDVYGAQRSQLILTSPLPSVEEACVAIQQEESRKDVLSLGNMNESDAMAMYSRGNMGKRGKVILCSACGRRGHTSEKCWKTTGYPSWHYRYKPNQRGAPNVPNKWVGKKVDSPRSAANNAQSNVMDQQTVTMTAQQRDQLLKLIPRNDIANKIGSEKDEEIDYSFSGMVTSSKNSVVCTREWIIDSDTSDHMASSLENLSNVKLAPSTFTITLTTGATAVITHIGDAKLPNGLKLPNVLYVPQFHYNLLSIHKLAEDSRCDVVSKPGHCIMIDSNSKEVIRKGEMRNGLYYLLDEKVLKGSVAMTGQKKSDVTSLIIYTTNSN